MPPPAAQAGASAVAVSSRKSVSEIDAAGGDRNQVRPELTQSWSAALQRQSSSVSVPVSFSLGATQIIVDMAFERSFGFLGRALPRGDRSGAGFLRSCDACLPRHGFERTTPPDSAAPCALLAEVGEDVWR